MTFRKVFIANVFCVLLFALGVVVGGRRYKEHHMRTYVVQVESMEKQLEIQADSIKREDGCVAFYRGDRLDTLMCPAMGRIIVTEKN